MSVLASAESTARPMWNHALRRFLLRIDEWPPGDHSFPRAEGNSKKAGPVPNSEDQPDAELWKPEHVGSAPHGSRAATRRGIRRGRPEAMGVHRETQPRCGSERARPAHRHVEAIQGRRPI